MGRRFPAKQTALTVQSSLTTLQLHVRIAYRCHFGTLLPMWSMFGHSGRCGSVPATPRACRRCGRRRLAAGRKRKARCRCRAASVGLALLLTLCLCVCGATPAVGLIFLSPLPLALLSRCWHLDVQLLCCQETSVQDDIYTYINICCRSTLIRHHYGHLCSCLVKTVLSNMIYIYICCKGLLRHHHYGHMS